MTFEELSWEFSEIFDELDTEQMNQVIAANVDLEVLEFFLEYCSTFARGTVMANSVREQLPNLMLIGYLLRTLEEKIEVSPS